MAIILDKYDCAPNSNTTKIKLEFMYMCVRGNDFSRVSTILLLDITAVVTVGYI